MKISKDGALQFSYRNPNNNQDNMMMMDCCLHHELGMSQNQMQLEPKMRDIT